MFLSLLKDSKIAISDDGQIKVLCHWYAKIAFNQVFCLAKDFTKVITVSSLHMIQSAILETCQVWLKSVGWERLGTYVTYMVFVIL